MKASERKNKSPSEYYNQFFKRGHPSLLWLINKPKGGANQKKGKGRVKTEDGEGDSDDDGRDGAEDVGPGYTSAIPGPHRAIAAAPESGPLQKREMAIVQTQLADIQKQQESISNAINRLRMEHNALYQQATTFQTMHDRHENSINAILTFLATIYNRSMDGQAPQNISQMFTGVPTADQHHQSQSKVVDLGQMDTPQQPSPGSSSPHRKAHQFLLMAPPDANTTRANTMSPGVSSTASPRNQAYVSQQPQHNQRFGTVEEVFDNSPVDSANVKIENDGPPSQQGIMDLINNTNARTGPGDKGMEFPDMLSHFEHANGQAPLSAEERMNMLHLIANTTSPGSNNALITPPPLQPLNVDRFNSTQAEIEIINRNQQAQQSNITRIRNTLSPLSPSGTIPGLDDGTYFNGTESTDPNNANLDLDQFLDSGAYYTGSSPLGGSYNYNDFTDANFGGSQFGGLDGTAETPDGKNRIVEALGSSQEGTTPESNADDVGADDLGTPPRKRRKG